ncbi:MAG: hypothetical protein E6J90_45995 [Deltaproteobacteria bacterium]|nr:MAG: hypothetical protein E6J90_45995 [Deltaproteobacteria bacterium]
MWWRRLRYVLLLTALCAIATYPVARRSCIAKTRAAEADELLGYLVDRVAAHVAATGRVPPTAAGPTPETGCCARGETCPVDAAAWSGPGWRELAFSIDGPHRFAYQYAPDTAGLSATLRAVGDVACDGAIRTVEVRLTVAGGKLQQSWSRKQSP